MLCNRRNSNCIASAITLGANVGGLGDPLPNEGPMEDARP